MGVWGDWNGDGVADWQDLAMLQFQIEEQKRWENEEEERIRTEKEAWERQYEDRSRHERNRNIAREMRFAGMTHFDESGFELACLRNNCFASDFTKEDREEIRRELM